MAGRQVNIEKDIQVNLQSGIVRGEVWCLENNRMISYAKIRLQNWDELDQLCGALQALKEAYASKIQRV